VRSISPSAAMQEDDKKYTTATASKGGKAAGTQNRKRGRKRIEEDASAIDSKLKPLFHAKSKRADSGTSSYSERFP
jgi:hypothetical protein